MRCDNPGCGCIVVADVDGTATGLRGTASEHTDTGGVNGAKWFACGWNCVMPAMQHAITEAWEADC
jgi:hypothetical protein